MKKKNIQQEVNAVDVEDQVKVIRTRQFGELQILAKQIFHFPDGIVGFEDLQEFVLVSDEATDPLEWLISVNNPDLGFPLLNPWLIDPQYDPGRSVDPKRHGAYVIVTLSKSQPHITANMRAPVILDPEQQSGKQIILTSDRYSTTQTLGAQTDKG